MCQCLVKPSNGAQYQYHNNLQAAPTTINMKIAVTGSSGFIGQVLVPLLLGQGHVLNLLTRQPVSTNNQENITFIHGDLLQQNSLNRLVAGMDVVINVAAMISISDAADKNAFKVNTEGTSLLLAAAQRAAVRRFIHVSSVAAFEQAPYDEPMDESWGPATAQPYSYDASKVIAQATALAYNSNNFEVIVLAPTAVTGPFDQRPSLLGKAVINMYKGNVPALFPGGVDFVDVRDVAAAIASALTRGVPGNTYLLSGRWVSLKNLSREVYKAKGKNKVLPILPLWLAFGLLPLVKLWARITGGQPYYTRAAIYQVIHSNKKIDHSKATAALDYKPRPFEETIKDEIDWFKKKGFLGD